jgi:hypothetical protein
MRIAIDVGGACRVCGGQAWRAVVMMVVVMVMMAARPSSARCRQGRIETAGGKAVDERWHSGAGIPRAPTVRNSVYLQDLGESLCSSRPSKCMLFPENERHYEDCPLPAPGARTRLPPA